MQDTYYCSLRLGASSTAEPPRLQEIAELVRDWLNDPRRGLREPVSVERLLAGTHDDLAPGLTVTSLRVESAEQDAFGVRLDHPDSEESDVFWRTDIVVSRKVDAPAVLRASVRVAMGSRDDSLAPIQVAYSRPRIVPEMIRRFGAHELVPLTLTPQTLAPDGARDFVKLLTHEDRTLPIVFVSARNWDDRPLIDPAPVADQLAGLAHVVVAASRFTSRRLGELIEQRLNCYDGGVRIYWPDLRFSDNPFRHPLWIPDRIRMIEETAQGLRGHLLGRIGRASVHRFVAGIARWGDLERAHTQKHLAQLRESGKAAEMSELFEVENERLERENRELKLRVQVLKSEAERARNEATAWRQSYEELRKGEPKAAEAQSQDQPIESVQDALDRAGTELGDRLVITGRVEADPTFDNPDGLYLALRWLGTTYRDARRGAAPCKDFDHSCREASGFWYRAHQSKVTMGKYENEYYLQWKGERVPLGEHIGTGSGKDSRSAMRIAFFYDDETGHVVVGYLGQHQSTDAT